MSSPLRERYRQDLQLAGLSVRIQEACTDAVIKLARHFKKSPDALRDEELRDYFRHLRSVRGLSRSVATIALCAVKFLWQKALSRSWTALAFVRAPREHKLPVIHTCESPEAAFLVPPSPYALTGEGRAVRRQLDLRGGDN